MRRGAVPYTTPFSFETRKDQSPNFDSVQFFVFICWPESVVLLASGEKRPLLYAQHRNDARVVYGTPPLFCLRPVITSFLTLTRNNTSATDIGLEVPCSPMH